MTSISARTHRRRGAPHGLLPLLLLSFTCVAASFGHAYALTPNDALAGAFEDGDSSSFKEMSTDDMSKQRGGFDGIAFGIFLNGNITSTPSNSLPPGVIATVTGPDQLQIIGGVGTFGNATGIFQFVNVVGNSNVINNNVIINVTVLPAGTADLAFSH
jgi:hypothetical protein